MSADALMTQEELDRAYSPSSCVPGFAAVLASYATRSAAARASLPHRRDLAYGPDPAERLDLFPARVAGAPLQVFVHGGHWQALSKEESCFPAPGMVAAGAAFVALGYGLAPARTLPAMVASVRRAVQWLSEHAPDLGVDPDRIYLSGSSAGAHLVAMAVAGPLATKAAGACLISGVYDLEPVRRSYVNAAVGMDQATAQRYSPIHWPMLRADDLIVARGVGETREYARQHQCFVSAVRSAGRPVTDLVVAGRDHFDLPLDLDDPLTLLGAAVFDQMGLASAQMGPA